MKTVSDFMSHPVETIDARTTVFETAQRMAQQDLGLLLVTHEGVAVGVVTDRDLVERVLAEGRDPKQTLVLNVLSTDPDHAERDEPEPYNVRIASISEETPISKAIEFMDQKKRRRVAVHDSQEEIVGILSRADLEKQQEISGS